MTPQAQQVDAIEVIDTLTAEIAALTRRAVIAEIRAEKAERRAAALENEINEEKKK